MQKLEFLIRVPSPNADGIITERVSFENAPARISELSGRNIGRYICATAIPEGQRRNGRPRAYVAANRQSEWRTFHKTAGFIVERSV